MSTTIRRRHVLATANRLMNLQGSTTTLDIKNALREDGHVCVQSDVSYEMQNLSEELEWPWNWRNEPVGHRVYFLSTVAQIEDAFADFTDAVEEATETVKEFTEVLKSDSPHEDADGNVTLDRDAFDVYYLEPAVEHWLLAEDVRDPIYIVGVPLDRKYRNPLRNYYSNEFDCAYTNVVANHGGVS